MNFVNLQKENTKCSFRDVTVFKEMFSEIQTCPSEGGVYLRPSQVISSRQIFQNERSGLKNPGTVPPGVNLCEQGHDVQKESSPRSWIKAAVANGISINVFSK